MYGFLLYCDKMKSHITINVCFNKRYSEATARICVIGSERTRKHMWDIHNIHCCMFHVKKND